MHYAGNNSFYEQQARFFIFGQKRFCAAAMKEDISYVKDKFWQRFNEHDRIEGTLTRCTLNPAELIFYQGMGLKDFGLEYSSKAIDAFEQAIKLDIAGAFTERAKDEIAKLEEEQSRNIL